MSQNLSLNFKRGNHILALDGLRGLAFLLVFCIHVFPYVQPFRLGWIGVDLFFVLSGFLITGILTDSKGSAGYYRNFIVRRALRIFPLYYFFIFLVIFILPAVFPVVFNDPYYSGHQSWYWLYVSNWLAVGKADAPHTFMLHLWSLSVEEQFYIFWPLVVMLFSTRKLLIVCGILALTAIIFRYTGPPLFGFTPPFQYINTIARMDSLLAGAVISILYRIRPSLLVKFARPLLLGSFLILAGIIGYTRKLGFNDLTHTFTFFDLFFGSLLIYAISDSENIVRKVLQTRFFRFFGKYSYGLYVYHYPIYMILVDKIAVRYTIHFPLDYLFWSIICMGLSIIIALISFYCLEKPFLSFKRYFETKNLPHEKPVLNQYI